MLRPPSRLGVGLELPHRRRFALGACLPYRECVLTVASITFAKPPSNAGYLRIVLKNSA